MKQMKVLSVLAAALALGLSACGGGKTSCKTHKWGEWEVTKAATCTEDGEESHKCTVCGEVKTRKIPAAHSYGEWVVTTAPTCTEVGSHQRTCSVCNDVQTEEVPATGHTWGEWETISAPDCTNAGSRKHTCSVCQVEESEEVPATGHTWGEWVDVQAPTCTEKGSHKRTCSVCSVEETEDVDALGHDIQLREDTTEPEAGKAAVRIYECSRCDVTYFGFKASEASESSKSHLVIGDDGGARFWGRPIGNDVPLNDSGDPDRDNHPSIFNKQQTGDFFEYVFDLTEEQAAVLQNVRCYCDAKPAEYLGRNGIDFWANTSGSEDWTRGRYIDDNPDHLEVDTDGNPVMVDVLDADGNPTGEQVQQGKEITDYRYVLYVDDVIQQFDGTPCPVPSSEPRAEYVMPYTFNFHKGENKISLRMAGGYRSTFYNFTFRPVEEEVPPEPVVDEWVEDTATVMPTPAADGALVKRYVKEGKDDVKYEIDVKTANMSVESASDWKTNPSTGAFKLNNGKTATFKFDLPKAFEGTMYQSCYMDSYNSNKTKKMFYETNNHCNIEVKVNDNAIDFSQFSTTTFQEVFGDELDGSNSLTKEVELGDVVLQGANVITYKRVETLNTIVNKFVFIGKDHDHAYVAGDKAADSALRSLSCTCGQGGYELQAADLTSGHKTPSSSDKNTRLGKGEMKDVWNVTGIAAGTYNLYLQAQNSQYNDDAYWNAGTAQDNGDSASNNGNSRDFRYYAYATDDAKAAIGSADNADLDQFSDFGLSYAGGPTWTNKPVAQVTIAEGATSFTIENMNNGYSIWIYAARLVRA